MQVDVARLSDEELTIRVRNRETTALLVWEPYMHNPKLRRRLGRIDVPSQVIWGAADRLVMPDYGRAYAAAIPNAQFTEINEAGHYPYLERPDEFVRTMEAFLSAR